MPRRTRSVRDHDAAALDNRMTDDEVIRFLREVRYSDPVARRSRQAPYSINAIAKQAGVHNSRIYEIVAGQTRLNRRVRRVVERITSS